jgi:hypothetical protein
MALALPDDPNQRTGAGFQQRYLNGFQPITDSPTKKCESP